MILNEHNSLPHMKSLAACLNRMLHEGYSEGFMVTEQGLASPDSERHYRPEEIQVVNFYRFEGQSDPDDNAILYVIETNDGSKGTLIDAYGTYTDGRVGQFMKEVESIRKKVTNY